MRSAQVGAHSGIDARQQAAKLSIAVPVIGVSRSGQTR